MNWYYSYDRVNFIGIDEKSRTLVFGNSIRKVKWETYYYSFFKEEIVPDEWHLEINLDGTLIKLHDDNKMIIMAKGDPEPLVGYTTAGGNSLTYTREGYVLENFQVEAISEHEN